VLLIGAMLSLLVAFFALFVSLVRFAEHIIRPRNEAVLPTDVKWSERTTSKDAAS
jgi:hypothetical protein